MIFIHLADFVLNSNQAWDFVLGTKRSRHLVHVDSGHCGLGDWGWWKVCLVTWETQGLALALLPGAMTLDP